MNVKIDRIDVHVHLAGSAALVAAVHTLSEKVTTMNETLSQAIEALRLEAKASLDAQNAAETVLRAIPDFIQQAVDRAANATDVAGAVSAIQEVVDGLRANTPELAAAIVAGTPADPAGPSTEPGPSTDTGTGAETITGPGEDTTTA